MTYMIVHYATRKAVCVFEAKTDAAAMQTAKTLLGGSFVSVDIVRTY